MSSKLLWTWPKSNPFKIEPVQQHDVIQAPLSGGAWGSNFKEKFYVFKPHWSAAAF